MSINSVWDNNEHSVLRVTFENSWTWEELDVAVAELHSEMSTVHHQVDTIVDMRASDIFPEGAFWRFHKLASIKHHNRGRIIIVSSNNFVRTLMDALRRLARDLFDAETFVLVSTVEEARAVLFRQRLELASGF
ncbi:MAG: hypothetical protein U0694_16825 [Anaerolineae bacterium]